MREEHSVFGIYSSGNVCIVRMPSCQWSVAMPWPSECKFSHVSPSPLHRGPGFDYRALLRIFLRELGLERGLLSLVIG
jgi:hypothetical protein